MPTILNWPERGEWLLAQPVSPIGRNEGGFYRKAEPPFAVLTVYFKTRSGSVRIGRSTRSQINNISLVQTREGPKFSASYAIGAHSGRFEAIVRDKYELEIEFTGTAVTSVNAHPIEIVGADTSVASMSTQDKLQEAIRRALPALPAEARREVEAIFTPAAIAVLAVLAGLWAASHLAVVGVIADFALVLTGGILLGKLAWDVGTHLAEFMTGACGATTDKELDAAAEHFAAAIMIGGTTLVASLLFSKRPGRDARPRPPARAGEKPLPLGEPQMVLPSNIPPASRTTIAPQGQQPALAGLSQEVQQLVRSTLNRIRRADIQGNSLDCAQGCELLNTASNKAGIVQEGTSGVTPFVRGIEHTMWEIGGQFIDTRPGWWRNIFRIDPKARAALENLIPGLPERLENGAVLTAAEHGLFQGRRVAPPSPMFDNRPIRPSGNSSSRGSSPGTGG